MLDVVTVLGWRPGTVTQRWRLVDLLLLVDAELAGAAVDQEQETAHDRQDLEEVVLGKVLVRMALVELKWFIFVSRCNGN